MNTISERLQYLRESHNLKQQDVADATGIARGNISKYENGVVNPSADTLIAYSKFFNVSTDWILTGEGKGPGEHTKENPFLVEAAYGTGKSHILKSFINQYYRDYLREVIREKSGTTYAELTDDVLEQKIIYLADRLTAIAEREIDESILTDPSIVASYKIDDTDMSSPEWLLVNKLKKLASDDIEEIELLINFKAERKLKREQINNLKSGEEAAAYDADVCQKRIPILGQVAAGTPIWAESEYMDLIPVPANNTRIDYALVVRGDSMEPDIHNGSILFVKRQAALENGDIGIILIDDSATCKKFYKYEDRIELHSLNKKYDPIIIKGTDHAVITILGKALKVSESSNGNSYVVNSRLA